jgi:hypothetical protein
LEAFGAVKNLHNPFDTTRAYRSFLWPSSPTSEVYPEMGGKVKMHLKPRQVMSLWDMIQFYLGPLYVLINVIKEIEEKLAFRMIDRNSHSEMLDEELIKTLRVILGFQHNQVKALRLKSAQMLIDEILEDIQTTRLSQMCDLLKKVQSILEKELAEKTCLYIPEDRPPWYGHESSFGDQVHRSFPSARFDIQEAANCFALDRYTASVFHLMRCVEWGLRAFCADVGFDEVCIHKTDKRYVPVEYSQWEKILSQLPKRVDEKIEKMPPGADKESAQGFYYPILQDIRAFKDAWRNHVSHTRAIYDETEGINILTHVKNFMVRLSSKVCEI